MERQETSEKLIGRSGDNQRSILLPATRVGMRQQGHVTIDDVMDEMTPKSRVWCVSWRSCVRDNGDGVVRHWGLNWGWVGEN